MRYYGTIIFRQNQSWTSKILSYVNHTYIGYLPLNLDKTFKDGKLFINPMKKRVLELMHRE